MKIQFIFQIPALWDLVRKQKGIDEQLHVLPHYAIDTTDPETGSKARNFKKLETGALEVVQKFERKQILRSEPIRKKCKGTGYNLIKSSLSNGYSRPCDIKCTHVQAKCNNPKDATTAQ